MLRIDPQKKLDDNEFHKLPQNGENSITLYLFFNKKYVRINCMNESIIWIEYNKNSTLQDIKKNIKPEQL